MHGLEEVIAKVRELGTSAEAARAQLDLMIEARDAAILAAVDAGIPYRRIAAEAGITSGRVAHIIKAHRA